METFFLGAVYLILATITMIVVKRIDYSRICFADGVLFSGIFFVSIPLLLIMISGEFASQDFPFTPYRPFEDIATTLNFMVGWVTLLIFHLLWHSLFDNRQALSFILTYSRRSHPMVVLFLMLISYVSITLLTFFVSGRGEGGHWMKNLETAFAQNSYLVILANFANAYRSMVFGLIFYLTIIGKISSARAIFMGLVVVFLDISLSFNRITAAYFAVMVLLVYRRRAALIIAVALPISPAIMFLSNIWTSIRGLALDAGYSIDGFLMAIQLSLEDTIKTAGVNRNIAERSDGIFETSNLHVFSYIVNNMPERLEILWGWTFFLRPLTLFVPSTIWSGKPPTYGTFLGDAILNNGVTLNSTPFGEAYGNFYVGWPVALLFMLMVVSILFQQLEKWSPSARYCAFFGGFALGRFDLNFSAICVFTLLILLVVARLISVLWPGNPRWPAPMHERSRQPS